MSTLALKAQFARRKYDASRKTQRDYEIYMGECAALAFDAMVEEYNLRAPKAQQIVILAATRVAVKLLGEATADHLSCPIDHDHHHDNFAQTVWNKAVAQTHEHVATVRKLAGYLGL